MVRESDVQIYSIGIFDNYAPTQEEVLGPELLKEICEMTGGRLFNVGGDMGDLAGHCDAHLRRAAQRVRHRIHAVRGEARRELA